MINISDSFQLLTPAQKRNAIVIVLFTLVQAVLDVFTLAVIIPVFYVLFSAGNNVVFLNIPAEVFSENWKTVLSVIIVLFAFKNFIGLFFARKQFDFISHVAVCLTEKLYRRFYSQSWENYLKDNSAEIARKIKTTPSDFAQYILQGHITLISDVVSCLLMLGVMVVYDYRIVIVITVLVAPVALIYFFFRRNILSGVDRSFRELTPVSNIILTQGIDSFAEARIYQKEEFFIQRFMELRRTTSQHLANLNAASSVPSRLFELTGIVCFTGIIFYAKLSGADYSSMVVVLSLLTVAMYRIIPSLNRILQTLSQIQAYGYSVGELKRELATRQRDVSTQRDEAVVLNEKIIVTNLSFQYHNGKSVFGKVNFMINKGDFVMIEGPSGVGKSTLLHILAGLLNTYDGEIAIDDKALDEQGFRNFQHRIGFVPQSPTLFQDTLLKNITLAENENADKKRMDDACDIANLTSFIQSLPNGYHTMIGERGTNVSGGQRQRINLARAIYRDADILLLDEVTNQLDHQTKEVILNNLKALCAKGKTVILSSHDHLIKPYANKIINLG